MTPMMQQFRAAKDAYPGMVVFFQNGEFYELFDEDAELCHKVLGLTLTKREEHPMAGFPLAKLEHHLRGLLNAGYRVAVAEQMEPPNDGKKIIRREVTPLRIGRFAGMLGAGNRFRTSGATTVGALAPGLPTVR
jgi:DNA mismatch repair protein MutS